MKNFRRSFVLNMLAYAVQKDVKPQQLCQLCGIQYSMLKKKTDTIITDKQFDDLWVNAAHLCNDPLFGLHFGESLQLAALGVVGKIIQSSNTIGDAVTYAAQLVHLVTDKFGMQVQRTAKAFTIILEPADNGADYSSALKHIMDCFMVFTLHEMDGFVLEKITPRTVKFPYQLQQTAEYERVLRAKPRRGNVFSLEFDMRYWDEPVLTANYELQHFLLQQVQVLQKTQTDSHTMHGRISSYLLANAYLGIPSVEELAANFNTSARTMQRKLKEEGMSYQDIAGKVRASIAMQYLKTGNYQVKEISYLLGYNELSAFTRAFKRWTGKNPNDFRKEAQSSYKIA